MFNDINFQLELAKKFIRFVLSFVYTPVDIRFIPKDTVMTDDACFGMNRIQIIYKARKCYLAIKNNGDNDEAGKEVLTLASFNKAFQEMIDNGEIVKTSVNGNGVFYHLKEMRTNSFTSESGDYEYL